MAHDPALAHVRARERAWRERISVLARRAELREQVVLAGWAAAGQSPGAWFGQRCSVGGTNVSLMDRGEVQRSRFCGDPALSLVPDPPAPPNGCRPTTAPVGLSLK